MKKILTLIVGLLASGLALPVTAQAGGYRIGHSYTYNSGHHSCGCAIRTKRVVVGFDCYDRPIFRYYRLKTKHRCKSHRAHRRNAYQHRGHYRNHYERRRAEYRHRHYTPRRGYYRSRR